MMKVAINQSYEMDIKVTGYMRVTVIAENTAAAHEKAQSIISDDIMYQPISNLEWKDTEISIVNLD